MYVISTYIESNVQIVIAYDEILSFSLRFFFLSVYLLLLDIARGRLFPPPAAAAAATIRYNQTFSFQYKVSFFLTLYMYY